MDSAEQAALSDSERDASQTHSQTRHYDFRHIGEYVAENPDTPKSIKRFDDLVINLTHSSTLVPSGISLSGKYKIAAICLFFIKWKKKIFRLAQFRFRCPFGKHMVGTLRSNLCK